MIPNLMLRFRNGNFGVVADIKKAFLQIEVNERDRDYLRFLWYSQNGEKTDVFRHRRVVFGVNCSPFILGAIIEYHLSNVRPEHKPLAQRLQKSFYVDNLVTSVNSFGELQDLKLTATSIMENARMELSRWEHSLDVTSDTYPYERADIYKVLGIYWDKGKDYLSCEISCNPADLPSRGCSLSRLLHSRWWEGPSWLKLSEEYWPSRYKDLNEEKICAERKKIADVTTVKSTDHWYIKYFSLFIKNVWMMAWIRRFINNLRSSTKVKGELSVKEIDEAELALLKLVQTECFPSHSIPGLKVYDVEGILRVKTKLIYSSDEFGFRLQILLHGTHPLIEQIICDSHVENCHAGVQFLMNKLQVKYWIVKARQTIKKIVRRSVTSRRLLGTSTLKYQELVTLLCHAETVMNGRSMTYVSDDPNDLVTISPSLFLQEQTDVEFPECQNMGSNTTTQKLRYLSKLREDLKSRFRKKYLSLLVQRKRRIYNPKPRAGDVVLVGMDNKKRNFWPLAVIEEILFGRDGVNRLVKVKTAVGTFLRPIQKIYPLEISSTEASSRLMNDKEKTAKIQTRSGRTVCIPNRLDDCYYFPIVPREKQVGVCGIIEIHYSGRRPDGSANPTRCFVYKMAEELILRLKKKRAVNRSYLTKTCNKIESGLDTLMIIELEELLEQLNESFNELKLVDHEIETFLETDDLEKELQGVEEYREKYITWRFRANKKIRQSDFHGENIPNSNSRIDENEMRHYVPSCTTVKLPKLMISKFYGNFRLTFWNSFDAAIHQNNSLNPIDKFNYLKSHLGGTALNTVEGFALSADNYEKAIKLLKDRFGREDILISRHMNNLLSMRPLKTSSDVRTFRELFDNLSFHIRSLESLNVSIDVYGQLLCPIIIKILPADLNLELNKELPTGYVINDLITFLERQLTAREKSFRNEIGTGNESTSKPNLVNKHPKTRFYNEKPIATASELLNSVHKSNECVFCGKDNHGSPKCDFAANISLNEKRSLMKKKGVCYKCLRPSHLSKFCRNVVRCSICNMSSHLDVMCTKLILDRGGSSKSPTVQDETLANLSTSPDVLLPTLRVTLKGNRTEKTERAIIDTGSQRSYILHSTAMEMEYEQSRREFFRHSLFGGSRTDVVEHEVYTIHLSDINNSYRCEFEALGQPLICGSIPPVCPRSFLEGSEELDVSDLMRDRIEVLIGADIAARLLTDDQRRISSGLVAIRTKLGWTVMGKIPPTEVRDDTSSLCVTTLLSLDLENLWKLDAIGVSDAEVEKKTQSLQAEMEEHFAHTTTRDIEGRYEVALPWVQDKERIPSNRDLAENQLISVRRKLEEVGDIKEYGQIFEEWMKQGIIEYAREDKLDGVHYLPHRPVYKRNSQTSRIRPVFNASARKRDKAPEHLKITAEQLKSSFYVDNCLSSFQNVEETEKFVKESTELLSTACFNLRDWLTSYKIWNLRKFQDFIGPIRPMLSVGSKDNWAAFVMNRVKEIHNLSSTESWRHIPGRLNPADLPSRGCSAESLKETRWWEGPAWLKVSQEEWPKSTIIPDLEIVYSERRKTILNTLCTTRENENLFGRYSHFLRIVRITAWIYRFFNNAKIDRRKIISEDLSTEQITKSEIILIRLIQRESFSGHEDKKLQGFKLLVDSSGILRIKTKICRREDFANFRMPILLPSDHFLVSLLIRWNHETHGHAGLQTLLGILRENYWILRPRKTVKKIINQCIRCKRFTATPATVESTSLPEDRVRDAAVFEIVGVDLTGHLILKNKKKAWIVIFTCAVYRGVHLELVTSLSMEAFLQAFRRFIARRGRPLIVYSDNGTNFRGMANALKKIDFSRLKCDPTLKNITWKFIPPDAPWWGGWWERLIGMMKQLLFRILGQTSLGYEELSTVMCDVESLMNTRPLTYLTEESEDLAPLTPSLFLHEVREVGVPDLDLIDNQTLSRKYQYIKRVREDLRERFRIEYFGLLRQETRRLKTTIPFKVGDMVLIGQESLKRLHWPLARIIQLYPGKDGLVRVAKVKTSSGDKIRPIQKLYNLEITPEIRCRDPLTERSPTQEVRLTTEEDPLTSQQEQHHIDTPNVVSSYGRPIKRPNRLDLLNFTFPCLSRRDANSK
ncbi:hypothetical protein LAZ67_11002136, partial [Cordylochernes scorpioides]